MSIYIEVRQVEPVWTKDVLLSQKRSIALLWLKRRVVGYEVISLLIMWGLTEVTKSAEGRRGR